MSILKTRENLLSMYSDQLIKGLGDIKNNSRLTPEQITYTNSKGALVKKTVYKNENGKEITNKTLNVQEDTSKQLHEPVDDHNDLISGDVIKCTTKSGKTVLGTYTRKTVQTKKGVKTEYLEFLKSDGTKGYVTLNGSIKIERKLNVQTAQTILGQVQKPQVKDLTVQESLDKLKKIGCNVSNVYLDNKLFSIHEKIPFDFHAIYQGYASTIDKATKGKVKVKPENFIVKISPNSVNFTLNVSGFEIEREVSFSEKSVDHIYLAINKNYQNGGIGKELFRTLYRQYKAAKIETITVSANIDIGGYSWMAYGFSAKTEVAIELIKKFSYGIGTSYLLTDKVSGKTENIEIKEEDVERIKFAFKKWKEANPKEKTIPMNILSSSSKNDNGHSSFKAWIIGTHREWKGELDLTDKTRSAYFENYIGYNQ
jgi:ribosomal protein S18 acetylase RimI-like enzyme